jgi:hypothetical protein
VLAFWKRQFHENQSKTRAKQEQAVNTLDNLVQSRKNKKDSGKDFLKVAQTVKVFNQKNNNR